VRSSGFTLIEILVVLGIVGVLLLVGIPNFRDRASDERAAATARQLAADLRAAQQEAVALRTAVSVRFAAADVSCPQGSASYATLRGAALVRRVCLPRDVQVTSLPPAGVTFEAMGIPRDGVTVRLRSARTARAFAISVVRETGAVVDVTH